MPLSGAKLDLDRQHAPARGDEQVHVGASLRAPERRFSITTPVVRVGPQFQKD
jgi:hypothetical protein